MAVSGSPNAMAVCPRRKSARSAPPVSWLAPSPRTCRITSAERKTSSRLPAIRTLFSTYSESGKPARSPAPDSMRSSTPVLFRTPIAPGAIATRRSPGADSARTPTTMPIPSPHKNKRIAAVLEDAVQESVGRRKRLPICFHCFVDSLQQIRRTEEEPQFRLGRLRRVGAVYAVALDVGGEALPYGALGRVGGVGGAHGFTPLRDGVLALQGQHDDRSLGHKLYQARIERPLAVYRVKPLRLGFREPRHAQGQDLETGLLDRGEDLASLARGDGVRLDNRKRAFYAHKRLWTFSPISAGEEQTVMPASSMALILSVAFPEPPAMIAPAWPMRRPGGAVWPATKPITGFFTWAFT